MNLSKAISKSLSGSVINFAGSFAGSKFDPAKEEIVSTSKIEP